MASGDKGFRRAVGNLALARLVGAPEALLRRVTYVAGTREREVVKDQAGVQRIERTLPLVYEPAEADGILGQVGMALR